MLGHSLGGMLTLHAAHRDARLFRAIAVAPFLGIKRLPRDWNGWMRSVLERAPNRFLYWNPFDHGRSLPLHGYPRYSTRSVAAGLALADALRKDARSGPPRARHIEIVRNAGEVTVNNQAIDELVANWRRAGGDRVRIYRPRPTPPSTRADDVFMGCGDGNLDGGHGDRHRSDGRGWVPADSSHRRPAPTSAAFDAARRHDEALRGAQHPGIPCRSIVR
jgi:pimeloyl-ACP methyl ester carboxylesterase